MEHKFTAQEILGIQELKDKITGDTPKRLLHKRSENDIYSFLQKNKLKSGKATPYSKSLFGQKSNLANSADYMDQDYRVFQIAGDNYLIDQNTISFFYNGLNTQTPKLDEFDFGEVKVTGSIGKKLAISAGIALTASLGLIEIAQNYVAQNNSRTEIRTRLSQPSKNLTDGLVKLLIFKPAYEDTQVESSSYKIAYPIDGKGDFFNNLKSYRNGSINVSGKQIPLANFLRKLEFDNLSEADSLEDLSSKLSKYKFPFDDKEFEIITDDKKVTLEFIETYSPSVLRSKLDRIIVHENEPYNLFEIANIINNPKEFFKTGNENLDGILETLDYTDIQKRLNSSIQDLDLYGQVEGLTKEAEEDSLALYEILLNTKNNKILPNSFSRKITPQDLLNFKKGKDLNVDLNIYENLISAIQLKQYVQSNTKLANFLNANGFEIDIEAIKEREVLAEQYRAFQDAFSKKLVKN